MGGLDARLSARAWAALVRASRSAFLPSVGALPLVVNYRLRGRYYVVDRLFAAAELRLGEGRQQVVRIVRQNGGRGRGGRGS